MTAGFLTPSVLVEETAAGSAVVGTQAEPGGEVANGGEGGGVAACPGSLSPAALRRVGRSVEGQDPGGLRVSTCRPIGQPARRYRLRGKRAVGPGEMGSPSTFFLPG
jgi:hypothetical protein